MAAVDRLQKGAKQTQAQGTAKRTKGVGAKQAIRAGLQRVRTASRKRVSETTVSQKFDAHRDLNFARSNKLVVLHRSALLTLPGGHIGFFVHRKPQGVLDACLVLATVTAVRRNRFNVMRELRARAWLALTWRSVDAADEMIEAEYFCVELGDHSLAPEEVARDAGWAKLIALCSMNAEAEARVLLRLATARRGAGGEGTSKWAQLRERWRRNDAGLSSSHGVTHAELVESTPFRPLRNPRRLFFVWSLTLGAIICSSLFIVLYSLAPCADTEAAADESPASGLCLSDPSAWNSVSTGWGLGLLMEILIDDPLFIGVSLLLRTYFPVLILYELIWKNRYVMACLGPVSKVYDGCMASLGSCLGL